MISFETCQTNEWRAHLFHCAHHSRESDEYKMERPKRKSARVRNNIDVLPIFTSYLAESDVHKWHVHKHKTYMEWYAMDVCAHSWSLNDEEFLPGEIENSHNIWRWFRNEQRERTSLTFAWYAHVAHTHTHKIIEYANVHSSVRCTVVCRAHTRRTWCETQSKLKRTSNDITLQDTSHAFCHVFTMCW